MTLDRLCELVAEALGGEHPDVFCAFPDAEKRVGGAPFGVLSLEKVELKAIGFGRSPARRGVLTFKLTVYASDGAEAASAMQRIAARCSKEEMRGLLGDCKFTAGGLHDGRLGLAAADAAIEGCALMELGSAEDAEVVVLNLRGHLRLNEEGEI